MDTYKQDETIPIYIILQYDIFLMKFPINPSELKMENVSESEEVEVEGVGKVAIPKRTGLAKIKIESFFWHQNNMVPGALYVKWLNLWRERGKPAKLIVTRFNYSMEVICENFTHSIKAGEEKDIYFILSLKEYRPYGAKKIKTYEGRSEKDVNAVLIDVPVPNRSSTRKKTYSNPYVVLKNESIMGITKKITGTSEKWNELYEMNKVKLGDIFSDSELQEGTELILPSTWIESKSVVESNI